MAKQPQKQASKSTEEPLWEVFLQEENGRPHEHAGSLHAADAERAMLNARDVFGRRGNVVSIWIVPAVSIHASNSQDNDSFFDPADDKVYRHPQFYTVPRGVKDI